MSIVASKRTLILQTKAAELNVLLYQSKNCLSFLKAQLLK